MSTNESGLKVITLPVSMFESNCYLVYDDKSLEGVIIDPGDESERIIEAVDEAGFKPLAILLTHGHGDHIGAVGDVKTHYRISVYAGKGEEQMIELTRTNFPSMYGMQINCPDPDFLVSDGEELKFESLTFNVFATPGHSPAGVCYYVENLLFTGDTLFQGSIGRTDLPGGSYDILITSIRESLLALPDDTICFPGHGPSTTIGRERTHNPFLTGEYLV